MTKKQPVGTSAIELLDRPQCWYTGLDTPAQMCDGGQEDGYCQLCGNRYNGNLIAKRDGPVGAVLVREEVK